MSRGNRVAVSGIISTSMRDNYGEYGVEEYYKKVGSTYRNPHYPGIRLCLFAWLNRWLEFEQDRLKTFAENDIMVLDMAAGKKRYQEEKEQQLNVSSVVPKRKLAITPNSIDNEFPRPQIMAADPFTSTAYAQRTSLPCAEISFNGFAEGLIPSTKVDISTGQRGEVVVSEGNPVIIEMVICSFAMHLVENPSSLFALLWELSLKARWLIILAPHKKPEIKDGWGWSKWNADTWVPCRMSESKGEFTHER
ncbi:hypothetical protein BJ165DRAFT_1527565 [Panaeolus papilionaceus]|nr:hypothetical protein BJ165DRAFT_1527565 [Panaeolus papilionaceus]